MFLPWFGKKSSKPRYRPSLSFGRRLLFAVLYTGLPAAVLSIVLLWTGSFSIDHRIEGTALVLVFWVGLSFSTRNGVVRSIQVLSNVVSSMKEEDFSMRAPQAISGDAFGELAIEINSLARALEAERRGAIEAENLLRKVIEEVEAVIFAFSPDKHLKLFNRAAAAFLGKAEVELASRTAQELGISDLLQGPSSDTISRFSAGIEKRWIVRRTDFRQHGIPHRLIVLSEASEALRAEERLAWQRLVRVLGHEINNSLAPIKSVSRTLARITDTCRLPSEICNNFKLGLEVISTRAEALNRFLQGYAKLTRLPKPTRRIVPLRTLVNRVSNLESSLKIGMAPGPEVNVNVDADQLEQALINLTRNAVESVLMQPKAEVSDSPVTICWAVSGNDLELWVRDRGVGLLDESNLFVPFYTTKETGTGIGMLLSRQIIEAHGGRLTIRNREDTLGCEVYIRIPMCVAARVI